MSSGYTVGADDLDTLFKPNDGSSDIGYNTGFVTSATTYTSNDLRYRYAPQTGTISIPNTGYKVFVDSAYKDLSEIFEPTNPIPLYTIRTKFSEMEYAEAYQTTIEPSIELLDLYDTFDTAYKPNSVIFSEDAKTVLSFLPSKQANVKLTTSYALLENTPYATVWEVKIEPTNTAAVTVVGFMQVDSYNYLPDPFRYYFLSANDNSSWSSTNGWLRSDGQIMTNCEGLAWCADWSTNNLRPGPFSFGPGDVIGIKTITQTGTVGTFVDILYSTVYYYKNGVYSMTSSFVPYGLPDAAIYTGPPGSNPWPQPPPEYGPP